MKGRIRVRFAPSPTGPLHLGGLRTALYNFLFARQHEGDFVLRIEDTDQTRLVSGAEDYIYEALHWCGLAPDEGPREGGEYGPYRQSDRRAIYEKHVAQLVKAGKAYYAFDTVEELDAMRQREAERGNHVPKYDQKTRMSMKNGLTLGTDQAAAMVREGHPHTVRLLVPEGRTIRIEDAVRGSVQFESSELDDKVILKADGLPTYHLANVVDDRLMKITHVIRGEEWLSSTAHHVLLYEGFGWLDHMPTFAHIPLILKPTGKGKLSKRDGQKFGFPVFPLTWRGPDETFPGFKDVGFDPQAMLNFVSLLGWNPGTEQEIFSMDELIAQFSIEHISKSGARFDFDKARWFNAQYLMHQDPNIYLRHVRPFLQEAEIEADDAYLGKVIGLMQERIQTYRDFPGETAYFFGPVRSYNQKVLRKKWVPEIKDDFMTLSTRLVEDPDFNATVLKSATTAFIEERGRSFGEILPLLRLALSGDTKGPDVFAMMEVLGRGETRHRLYQAEDEFAAQLELGNSPTDPAG